MDLQIKGIERESLLNFTLFTYFWRAKQKREYRIIINDMNIFSESFIGKGLIHETYTTKEISDELYRLKDWRVIKENVGSTYFELNQGIMENLNQNEKEIIRLAQGNETHEFVLKTIQEFSF